MSQMPSAQTRNLMGGAFNTGKRNTQYQAAVPSQDLTAPNFTYDLDSRNLNA